MILDKPIGVVCIVRENICPLLKIGQWKTLFLKHTLRRLSLWVCLGTTLAAYCEPVLMNCELIQKLIFTN